MTTYAQHPDSETLGDVGHGGRFGADLFYLFRAGKAMIPEAAAHFSDAAIQVHHTTSALESLASSTGEPAMRQLLAIRDDLHLGLRRTSLNLHATGEAVEDTAKDYVRTDEDALARFRAMQRDPRFDDDFLEIPDYTPPPRSGETPENEQPDRYGLPGRS